MKNKLACLGFLGFIGIAGILNYSPVLLVFLVFFFFFSYWDSIPDELFWENVRRAGLLALAVYFGLTILAILFLWCRTAVLRLPAGTNDPKQLLYGMVAMVLIFMITVCTFGFSLMALGRRERRALEGEGGYAQNQD